MSRTFEELGLSGAVAAAASAAGYDRPTSLQVSAVPVLRRGGNVLLHASSGAGVTAAVGLALVDRLADGDDAVVGVRALVVTPTTERADAVAHALTTLAVGSGVQVRAAAPGWRVEGADVLVISPAEAMRLVQTSSLKLEQLVAFVVLDAADSYRLGGGDAVGTLAPLIPRDAQRVVATAELTPDVESFVEAQARKALTVPARLADPDSERGRQPKERPSAGQIGYMVVEETGKPEMLARLLEGADEALVFTRTAARARMVLHELSLRGVDGDGGTAVRALAFDADASASARIVSYDVPFDADALSGLHETGGTVLVRPAELAHFRRIADEAAFTTKQRRIRVLDESELAAFRASVEAALEQEDLSAQMLVLEPLFDGHSAVEVAAALSAMVRRRTPVTVTAAPTAAPSTGAAPKDAMTGAFTRLFVSIGTRDNIRAGDLVGAITGEAGIKGDQVGRIDIRDSFSVVEVAGPVAEKVIRALNGTTMRGRSLRVDFDRKVGGDAGPRDSPSRGGPPGRGGAPRGGGSGPRRDGPPRGPRGSAGPRDRGDAPPGRRPAGPPRRRD